MRIELISLNRGDAICLLRQWWAMPHVARWWGDFATNLAEFAHTPDDDMAFIAVDDTPVGYLRWQTVDLQELESVGIAGIPAGAVDVDILIADSDCIGKGIGVIALQLLLERLEQRGDVPLAGLCTSVENTSAARAFEKAGFTCHSRYTDPIFGPCLVYTATLPGS